MTLIFDIMKQLADQLDSISKSYRELLDGAGADAELQALEDSQPAEDDTDELVF
jgi:hypothetical protein